MSGKFEFGSLVELISFQGKIKAPLGTDSSSNFWVLVGERGQVVSEEKEVHPAYIEKGERVLVRFNVDIDSYGLPNHNEIPNSLWIYLSDLKEVEGAGSEQAK